MADFSEIYNKMGVDYDINTMTYRFGVIMKALGINITDDIPVLSPETRIEFLTYKMTPQTERLLLLFAARVITESELINLNNITKDISGVLKNAEDFIKADNNRLLFTL